MSLFIIYTNQLRIHNKFALGNLKKKISSQQIQQYKGPNVGGAFVSH